MSIRSAAGSGNAMDAELKQREVKVAKVIATIRPPVSTAQTYEPEDEPPLYLARRKIYPQSVHGTFRRIKWAVLIVTLGIYYFLPFVRWNRGRTRPTRQC